MLGRKNRKIKYLENELEAIAKSYNGTNLSYARLKRSYELLENTNADLIKACKDYIKQIKELKKKVNK